MREEGGDARPPPSQRASVVPVPAGGPMLFAAGMALGAFGPLAAVHPAVAVTVGAASLAMLLMLAVLALLSVLALRLVLPMLATSLVLVMPLVLRRLRGLGRLGRGGKGESERDRADDDLHADSPWISNWFRDRQENRGGGGSDSG